MGYPLDPDLIKCLLIFNDRLDPLLPADLCEPELLDLLDALFALDLRGCKDAVAACFWLSAARMAELTLLCAGNYADCAAFSLAGDLLANPVKIKIDFGAGQMPLTKWRHGRLSDQVGQALSVPPQAAKTTAGAFPVIQRSALLPELRRQLEAGGMMSNGYLDSLDRRMARVATTLSFLAAWQVRDGEDLWLRLKGAEASEKALVESALCRFETRMFHRIGEDLRRIAGQEGAWSDFLTVARPQVEAVDFFCPSLCQI